MVLVVILKRNNETIFITVKELSKKLLTVVERSRNDIVNQAYVTSTSLSDRAFQ
jgi:hypothetical protein